MEMKITLVFSTVLVTISAFADNWVYDPNGHIDYLDYTGGVVSDGTWTFKATVSGSSIKFGAIATNVYPEQLSRRTIRRRHTR